MNPMFNRAIIFLGIVISLSVTSVFADESENVSVSPYSSTHLEFSQIPQIETESELELHGIFEKDVFLCGVKIVSVGVLVYGICQLQLNLAGAVCAGTANPAVCVPAVSLAAAACGYDVKVFLDFINSGSCR